MPRLPPGVEAGLARSERDGIRSPLGRHCDPGSGTARPTGECADEADPPATLSSEPGDLEPAIYLTLLSVVDSAAFSIYPTMVYFVPDDQTFDALARAARRGVDVKIIVPSQSDFWAAFYAGRDAGVELYERQETLLHSKTAVIDGVWSTVGSSNIDSRSFLHNAEVNAVILGVASADEMTAMLAGDLDHSVRIDPERWSRRPLRDRVAEWTAEMWDYWL